MEDSPRCDVMWKRRLVARFPCNLAASSARFTLPSMDPEPPRKAPNLSPEPSPKEAVSVGECGNPSPSRSDAVVHHLVARLAPGADAREAVGSTTTESRPLAASRGRHLTRRSIASEHSEGEYH